MSNLLRKECEVLDSDRAKNLQCKGKTHTKFNMQSNLAKTLEYGIFSSNNNDRGETNETDKCNPPTRKMRTEVGYMIQKRLNAVCERQWAYFQDK